MQRSVEEQASPRVSSEIFIDYLNENQIIDEISRLPWHSLQGDDIIRIAQAYYFFSVQFRENLEIALTLWPNDQGLLRLYLEECNTDNLSPCAGVADVHERLNHDEFIRRLLTLQAPADASRLARAGAAYLETVHGTNKIARGESIISYEDGGLSKVFEAILLAPCWNGSAAHAFKFFLQQHIQFDKHERAGHGSLIRHLRRTQDITSLWTAFRNLLVASVPQVFDQPAGPVPDKVSPQAAALDEVMARPKPATSV